MKRISFISALVFSVIVNFAQTDTLFTGKGQKISCKIFEISEFEIRYRMANAIDGPVYVVDKSTIIKYTLSNGFTERLLPDEMSLQNEHKEILGNRSAIKIHPFGFAFNHISFAYEQVIKVGMNLDIEAGYINSGITNVSVFGSNGINGSPYTVGAYLKPGLKFFLGQDFSVKGLKYAHPLKGKYIKIDLVVAYLNFQNIQYNMYAPNYSSSSFNAPTYTTISTDLNSVSYGGFINYGRQFILGNMFTLDYYVGAGFTGQSHSYSNGNYVSSVNQYNGTNADVGNNISNYYSYLRIPGFGLSFTAGFRLGFILPAKKSQQQAKADKAAKANY